MRRPGWCVSTFGSPFQKWDRRRETSERAQLAILLLFFPLFAWSSSDIARGNMHIGGSLDLIQRFASELWPRVHSFGGQVLLLMVPKISKNNSPLLSNSSSLVTSGCGKTKHNSFRLLSRTVLVDNFLRVPTKKTQPKSDGGTNRTKPVRLEQL